MLRLFEFQLERDITVAAQARSAIENGFEFLREFPFSCRKAIPDNPFFREILIPFGTTGYVALFEIEDDRTVTILAVRHQLEEDYH